MADAATASLTVLCGLTFVLGLRHGFDADHLAVIDAMARLNAAERPRLARYCGTLFSLGHGALVIVCACAVTQLASRWTIPGWLEATGLATSVSFLIALGVANLRAVRNAGPSEVVRPVGFRSRLMPPIRSPLAVFGVGMLFALSFDTFAQATVMGLAGIRLGGTAPALAASLFFVGGMLTTDGMNGLWISRLIRGADLRAAEASRAMSLVIGLASLSIGLLGLGALAIPSVGASVESYGPWVALGVVLASTITFGVAMLPARRAESRLE